ncbi:TonB-dependent receptor [Oleiharenicola lentus]|uniref:TonB-dependent receptor n=1 Tax=Oleiharenicola lentus TaxID=2508720 RepID=UPI003F665DBA
MITTPLPISQLGRFAFAASFLFTGWNLSLAQTAPNGSDSVVKLDTIQVTGTALRSQEAVNNRREALGVVDTLTMDDTGDLADENLADAMIRLPGVSTMQTLYGEQEASYVSTRGISPDLNFVSFDGIAMFSTASDGDGLRRVDLNLIPTQISRTTSVFKTFTADLDAGAIGGVTNIEPYSALNGREIGHITGQLTQQTGSSKYIPGVNSRGKYKDEPLGGGVKGLWVKRLGRDGQFGVVLSGVYRQRNYDYTKRNANGRVFYTPTGATAAADLSNWDGLHPFPTLIRPMDYTHYTETFGGSAQLEYKVSNVWQLSLLGFGYKQTEDQNLNQFYVETFTGLTRPSPELGRFKIGRTRASYSYDRFELETGGLIFKAVGKLTADSALEFRAGRYTNQFYDLDLTTTYAYSPPASFITFDMSDLVDKITIENNDPLANVANYRMNAAADNETKSKVGSNEARLDFKKNYASTSQGLGFAVGVNVRETEAWRDLKTITYTSNNSLLGDAGFVPSFLSDNYGYPVVWIDYAKFEQNVKPGLVVNANNSNNNSWLGDYFYKERIMAAYASVKYGLEKTKFIGGVRFDKVNFDALSPLDTTGIFDGTFAAYDGGYDHFLPSTSVTHSFTRNLRLKTAFSQSLGRPQFDHIAQAERRDEDALTITRGNPDLMPRRATNYDVALEYFFSKSGLVSLGAFYKDIKDDIYTRAVEEVIDGVTWTVTTPRNSTASTMKGLEFLVMHDAIPGMPGFLENRLGASFNYTKLWGEMDYLSGNTTVHLDALQYQPDWLANATVFYKLPKKKGEIRVSYNWKGESPISLGAYAWTTYWLRKQERLDVALRYSITKNFIVKFQANNLTDEPVEQGYLDPYAMNRYEMGRDKTFAVDFTYKF